MEPFGAVKLQEVPVRERTFIRANIVRDSVCEGHRLTTMEMVYPLFIHNELMTHRAFSRNAASSRAIPISKMIERVLTDPAKPVSWRKNQAGMQPGADLGEQESHQAARIWAEAAQDACESARRMETLGVHKEITNRLLAPFVWMTTLVSATDWANFFHLRTDPNAQKEFQVLACLAADAYYRPAVLPARLDVGDYHLPYITDEDRQEVSERYARTQEQEDNPYYIIRLVSTARCARVSYLTHNGKRDIEEDTNLGRRLMTNQHWSPFEHVAEATGDKRRWGNFVGWKQFRKVFTNENIEQFEWTDVKRRQALR